ARHDARLVAGGVAGNSAAAARVAVGDAQPIAAALAQRGDRGKARTGHRRRARASLRTRAAHAGAGLTVRRIGTARIAAGPAVRRVARDVHTAAAAASLALGAARAAAAPANTAGAELTFCTPVPDLAAVLGAGREIYALESGAALNTHVAGRTLREVSARAAGLGAARTNAARIR